MVGEKCGGGGGGEEGVCLHIKDESRSIASLLNWWTDFFGNQVR